jgi:hypothetical protein
VPESRDRPRQWQPAQPVRFALLLGCLAASVLALLLARTGLGRAVGLGGGGSVANVQPLWCVPHGLPQLAHADLAQLRALRAVLPRVIAPIGGRRYDGGVSTPERMWSDDSPERLRLARLADGEWPAGYEMRWWTRGEADVAADVLAFADAARAKSFFELATSVRCRRESRRSAGSLPPGVRNLVWTNPDHVVEYDAYLQRGRLVYRIVDVPPPPHANRSRTPQRIALYAVDLLACTLPESDCELVPAREAQRIQGGVRSRLIDARGWRLRRGSPSSPAPTAAAMPKAVL